MTFEFENVPLAADGAAGIAGARCDPRRSRCTSPSSGRARSASSPIHGFPTAPFASGRHRSTELSDAVARIGPPAIVKTAAFGYDGKGQHDGRRAPSDARTSGRHSAGSEAVVEKRISLQAELSVVAARGLDGQVVQYPLFENRHANHILDSDDGARAGRRRPSPQQATQIGRTILEALDYVGVLCVEFFLSTDGELLVNELAPRPHNSGHLTFDAGVTSQFEQQVRAVCGLPLGSHGAAAPGGHGESSGRSVGRRGARTGPRRTRYPDVKLHLYGKSEPRPGRKMGHMTAMARTVHDAQDRVISARDALLA